MPGYDINNKLMDGAETSFGPDALKVIGRAFDEAWASMAGAVCSDPVIIEAARLRLAQAILSIATDDSRDVNALKEDALRAMAR